MYILYDETSLDTERLDNLDRKHLSPDLQTLRNVLDTPALHGSVTPYFISSISFHPADEESCYNYATFMPGHVLYMRHTRPEFARHIKNDLHQHDFYEFLFVLQGSIYQNIENKRHFYPAGSACLLNKNVAHMEEYSDFDTRLVFLGIKHDFFYQLFQILNLNLFQDEVPNKAGDLRNFLKANLAAETNYDKNYVDFIPLSENNAPIQEARRIFDVLITQTLYPKQQSSMRVIECLLQFFCILEDRALYHTEAIQIGSPSENELFEQITGILQRSNGHVSRRELERRLNYTGDYLNKITKKQTGLNLFQYGMVFCMKKAAKLLTTTDMSVSDIAAELGFFDRTHFYHIFKNTYHTTPAKYRKIHRRKNPGR